MKKPRLPTPEERALWHETNRGTVKQARDEVIVAEEISPPKPIKKQSVTEPMAAPRATKKPNLQALSPLTTREAKRRFKPHGTPEATLDLHGMTKLEAHEKLQQFITRQHRAGRRHIAIITGKGRGGEAGVLRSNLPHWLNEPALRAMISAFATAPQEKGGSGVTHVLLKRPV